MDAAVGLIDVRNYGRRTHATLFFFTIRFIAALNERSESQYSFHVALFAISAGAVRTVKRMSLSFRELCRVPTDSKLIGNYVK